MLTSQHFCTTLISIHLSKAGEKMARDLQHVHLRVSGIRKVMQKQMSEAMKGFGLSGGHAFYLLSLKDGPPEGATLKELTADCANNKAHTTRVVADLEEKGYVLRDYDQGMQKKFRIRLTENGKKVARAIEAVIEKQHETVFSCLSDEEYQEFLRLLQKILLHLQESEMN